MVDTALKRSLARCGDCVGFNVRRAARLVSQRYDDALRPAGLRGTQFSLLVMLERHGGLTVGALSEAMGMDRTTLTRNLVPLEREGLVDSAPGRDRRAREVRVTDAGRHRLAAALPLWEAAQEGFVRRLGADRFRELLAVLAALDG